MPTQSLPWRPVRAPSLFLPSLEFDLMDPRKLHGGWLFRAEYLLTEAFGTTPGTIDVVLTFRETGQALKVVFPLPSRETPLIIPPSEAPKHPGNFPLANNGGLIAGARELLDVDRATLARFLGLSARSVEVWESNRIQPHPKVGRLIAEMIRNPAYWRERLRERPIRRPTPPASAVITQAREAIGASQGTLCRLLGVSMKVVRAWEAGRRQPGGISSRFLEEIQRNPEYWYARIREKTLHYQPSGSGGQTAQAETAATAAAGTH